LPVLLASQLEIFFFWIQGNPTSRKAYFVGPGERLKPRLSQTLTRGARPNSNSRPAVQISSPLSSRYAPWGPSRLEMLLTFLIINSFGIKSCYNFSYVIKKNNSSNLNSSQVESKPYFFKQLMTLKVCHDKSCCYDEHLVLAISQS